MQVVGRENLPANDEPAVYVANHQSFLVHTQHVPWMDLLPTHMKLACSVTTTSPQAQQCLRIA